MATVSFLVKSFVKANISSIIGLISTIIIMMIGYKLNIILHKHRSQRHMEITDDEHSNTNHGDTNILKGEKILPSNKKSPHHRRNGRICSCSCSYEKISISSIYKYPYGECMDNIHRLFTSELVDILISGFVLSETHHNTSCICSDIMSLISLYCNNHDTQIFIIKGSHKGRLPWLNKIECINLNYKLAYNINIYNVHDINDYFEKETQDERISTTDDENTLSLSTMDRDWDTEENGVCLVPNINVNGLIPSDVQQQINKIYRIIYNGQFNGEDEAYFDGNDYNKYNAVFKCAGMKALGSNLSLNSTTSMIIFKHNEWREFSQDMEDHHEVIGFEIDLPHLPRSQTYCAQTVYSAQYGLITNCRDNAFLLDIQQYVAHVNEGHNGYDWNRLCPMNHRRNWASSLCVIDNDSKLFICSGDGAMTKSVEIFDIEENKWYEMREMNHSFLMQSGIYYDYLMERVIVGGGYKTEQMITSYDIAKDKWIDLPNTRFSHSEYPSIWCNKFVVNNVLYIAGNSRNDLGVLEFLDLRERNKKWNLASNDMQINQYIETPQIYKHNNAAQMANHHRDESNYYPMEIRRTFV